MIKMDSKEKAQELVKQFRQYVYPFSSGSGYLTGDVDQDVILDNAKQCALIAVQQAMDIIDADIENCIAHRLVPHDSQKRKDYWNQVITEIKNITHKRELKVGDRFYHPNYGILTIVERNILVRDNNNKSESEYSIVKDENGNIVKTDEGEIMRFYDDFLTDVNFKNI